MDAGARHTPAFFNHPPEKRQKAFPVRPEVRWVAFCSGDECIFLKNIHMNKDLVLREYLAIERTKLANERTLLTYIRTGLYFLVAAQRPAT